MEARTSAPFLFDLTFCTIPLPVVITTLHRIGAYRQNYATPVSWQSGGNNRLLAGKTLLLSKRYRGAAHQGTAGSR